MWSWMLERWVRWWWTDAVFVAVGALVCERIVAPATGVDLLGRLTLSERRGAYTDMLQLATIFAGLGGVVFAIFVGLQSRSIQEIKQRVGERLLHVWMSALLAPWLAAFVIILASVADRGSGIPENGARWLAAGALGLVGLQLLRILWVFYQLAMIEVARDEPTIKTAQIPAVVRKKPRKRARKATSPSDPARSDES